MPDRFLIASADAGTRAQVRRAFSEFAIEAEECEGALEAFAHMQRSYQGLVLDCEDLELALQLLAGVRANTERATSVVALLPASAAVQHALAAGAKAALHKPFRIEHLARSLRVSFHLTSAKERQAAAKASVSPS